MISGNSRMPEIFESRISHFIKTLKTGSASIVPCPRLRVGIGEKTTPCDLEPRQDGIEAVTQVKAVFG
jgi:hypothetical protein